MNVLKPILPKDTDQLIGTTLIEAGRLRPEDAERILRLQREAGLRFGEAALKLGLVTPADIDFALRRQFGYQCLVRGESNVSEELIAAYTSSGPHVEALRSLRAQLMLRWFDNAQAHKALAVVSAARGEGRSFLAASLAVVFSQLGQRTLLIDADMRHPRQHSFFGLDNAVGLSAVLSGRADYEAMQRVPALLDLSVLPAGAAPPNPPELLSRPLFQRLLADAAKTFDVILLDSPATAECTDAHTVAARAGAALIVGRRNASRLAAFRATSAALAQANAAIVGTVLNDF
jgi:protein-tyrosine kinase